MSKRSIANVIASVFDSDNDYLSESLSENSDEETITEIVCSVAKRCHTTRRVVIENYVEKVIDNYTDAIFTSHFRVKRALYVQLAAEFEKSSNYRDLSKCAKSRLNITCEKHILTFLWFAGHQTSSYRDVADRFDLSLSSLFDVLSRVMLFLNKRASHVITLPNAMEKANTKNYYAAKEFPNVLGAVDGTHIRIDRPIERHTDYYNRKEHHSIILQGVCNESLKFMDIFVRYPGSVHDARVFRNSPLYSRLETFCEDDYILGDGAYPLLPNLITPFRDNGHLTRDQKKFNKLHSACRVSIEHAFGRLKQRFRQLYHLKLIGSTCICQFITSCYVLHNLCQDDGLTFDDDEPVNDDQPGTIPCTDDNKRRAVLSN